MIDSQFHGRRSIRLKGYDYSQAGAYFITVCTEKRYCLFGEMAVGRMVMSPAGHMVESIWRSIPKHYPGVVADEFFVMPNHIHGVIILTHENVGAGPRACPKSSGQPRGVAPTEKRGNIEITGNVPSLSIGFSNIVHYFKSLSTARYRQAVLQRGWSPFPGRLWQRNYYEHVIRGEADLHTIRQYIRNNPAQWSADPENPFVARPDYDKL